MGSTPGHSSLDEPVHTGFAATCRRKRFIVPVAIFITLLAIGGVLGGVLGTMMSSDEPGPPDNADAVSADDTNTKSALASSSTESLAVTGSSTSGTSTIILQSTDSELVSLEWHESQRTGRIVSSSYGSTKVAKPMDGSPFGTVVHPSSGDVHLFYIDTALGLAHVVRRAKASDNAWEVGALSTKAGQAKVKARSTDNMRLSVALVPGNLTVQDADYIAVLYQTDGRQDTLCSLSSATPHSLESWKVDTFSVGSEEMGAKMHPDSSGFVAVPVKRSVGGHEPVPGLRMLWDVDDSAHKTTLGGLECSFTESQALEQCTKAANSFTGTSSWVHPVYSIQILTAMVDLEAERKMLDAPKPLFLSAIPLKGSSSGEISDYIFRVLDDDGSVLELHGNNGEWTGHAAFDVVDSSLPKGIGPNFTAVASADDGSLFAMSQGQLLEFARKGEWWVDNEGAGWQFLRVVDTDI